MHKWTNLIWIYIVHVDVLNVNVMDVEVHTCCPFWPDSSVRVKHNYSIHYRRIASDLRENNMMNSPAWYSVLTHDVPDILLNMLYLSQRDWAISSTPFKSFRPPKNPRVRCGFQNQTFFKWLPSRTELDKRLATGKSPLACDRDLFIFIFLFQRSDINENPKHWNDFLII